MLSRKTRRTNRAVDKGRHRVDETRCAYGRSVALDRQPPNENVVSWPSCFSNSSSEGRKRLKIVRIKMHYIHCNVPMVITFIMIYVLVIRYVSIVNTKKDR